MKGYTNLGFVISNIQAYHQYIDELEKLPVVLQKYYTPICVPNYPCWLEYANERHVVGSVSITSMLYKNYILRKFTDRVTEELNNSHIGKNYMFKRAKLNIIRTTGEVGIHHDTGIRNCCINIGFHNSNQAITKISIDENLENFYKNAETFVVKEGYGYLLDTSRWHSVSNFTQENRYLITYSFSEPYDKMKEIFKNVL